MSLAGFFYGQIATADQEDNNENSVTDRRSLFCNIGRQSLTGLFEQISNGGFNGCERGAN